MKGCLNSLLYVLLLLVFCIGCEPEEPEDPVVEDVSDEEWIPVSPISPGRGEIDSMPPTIGSLYFFDGFTGFASTLLSLTDDAYNLLITYDGGKSWERIVPKNEAGKALTFAEVTGRNINELYLSGQTSDIENPERGLYRSLDGGKIWNLIWEKQGIFGAEFPAPLTIVSKFVGDIYLSNDNGETWKEVYNRSKGNSHPIGEIHFVNSNVGFAESGMIRNGEPPNYGTMGVSYFHKTTDGGYTWHQLQADNAPLEAVVRWNFISTTTGFGFTYNDKLLKTTDGGVSWQTVNDKLPQEYVTSSWFLNEKVGYYGTTEDNGMLYKTTDGGISWKRALPDYKVDIEYSPGIMEESSAGIYHLFFTPSGVGYAAGKYGTVWKLQKK